MSFMTIGATKLSQLDVDATKDWAGMGISNIKEVVLGMAEGDIVYYDGTRLVKLTPGAANTQLLTKGPKYPPKYGFPDAG